MRRAGIICDLDFSRHISFKNYYYAIEYLYCGVKLVTSVQDLDDIDILFVGDSNYGKHGDTLKQEGFVDKCNDRGIKVVIFITEKIFGSVFAWNESDFYFLNKFNNLYVYMIDVDDCIKTGAKLNRTLPSRHFADSPQVNIDEKLDEIVFLGNTEGYENCYWERKITLDKVREIIPLVIIPNTIELWEDYIKTISEYRFIFCPKGNCNAFPFRFYETLLVHSIPIQEVSENTLSYFDIEAGLPDCIFFQHPEELPDKIKNCTYKYSHSEMWMEDYLKKILTEDKLL
jgi:hypothetical protein